MQDATAPLQISLRQESPSGEATAGVTQTATTVHNEHMLLAGNVTDMAVFRRLNAFGLASTGGNHSLSSRPYFASRWAKWRRMRSPKAVMGLAADTVNRAAFAVSVQLFWGVI